MRVARVEFCESFVRIQTKSDGLTDPKGICDLLAGDASAHEIGSSVLRALSACRNFIPIEERRALLKEGGLAQHLAAVDLNTMTAFGFRKKRDIYRDMVACQVSEEDGFISFLTLLHVGMGNYKHKTREFVNPIRLTSGEEIIGSAVKTAANDFAGPNYITVDHEIRGGFRE
ncbi:contact-dependent growth inhibition system immunity protein [Lichenicoccus sp.]|uniref:contact-dependent growth inhibition system immunity protein n=1 Tax=Lichenicoccus sp. TaxID=2781899 RepID=UPI003D0BDA33